MTKRALFAVAGFLSLCLPLSAQQTERPDILKALNDSSSLCFPSLALSDIGSFSFAEAIASPLLFSWMETPAPVDVSLPPVIVRQPRRAATVSAVSATDSSKEVVDVQRPYFDYAGGEVGFLYGRSTGKFARDFEQGYIIGEVGNDKMQISAGAFYEHSSGRLQRLGR